MRNGEARHEQALLPNAPLKDGPNQITTQSKTTYALLFSCSLGVLHQWLLMSMTTKAFSVFAIAFQLFLILYGSVTGNNSWQHLGFHDDFYPVLIMSDCCSQVDPADSVSAQKTDRVS